MKLFKEFVLLVIVGMLLYAINIYDRWAIHKIDQLDRIEQRQKQISESKFTET